MGAHFEHSEENKEGKKGAALVSIFRNSLAALLILAGQ
jgi:hypothetical protein